MDEVLAKVAKQKKFDRMFMRLARDMADMTAAKRYGVGAVLVRDNRPVAAGYNGTPPGWDNCCETEHGETKLSVRHAEDNIQDFCRKHNIDTSGCTLYITVSPCERCVAMIDSWDLGEIVYLEPYRLPRTFYDWAASKLIPIRQYTDD